MFETQPPNDPGSLESTDGASRRAFLQFVIATGAGAALTGCASTQDTAQLPDPVWPTVERRVDPTPAVTTPQPVPGASAGRISVLSRTQWAKGRPVPSLMQPMHRVGNITVHHCAGPLFTATDTAGTIDRLDSIRRYHRSREWGDIGYHYAIDRGGRVWECRDVRYQGAHVKDHNEGNLGIVVLGNFDQQHPSNHQLETLNQFVAHMRAHHRVSRSRIRSHQEWGSPTACPGTSLQRCFAAARSNGVFG